MMLGMGSMSAANQGPVGVRFRPGDRRKNPRFDMHFSAFVRRVGESWECCETADVSAAGAFFLTQHPFPLHAPVEFILTFPSELTKAPQQLRMRFYASVVRCERIASGNGAFGVAVRNTAHRYLTREESAYFDSLDRNHEHPDSSFGDQNSSQTGT